LWPLGALRSSGARRPNWPRWPLGSLGSLGPGDTRRPGVTLGSEECPRRRGARLLLIIVLNADPGLPLECDHIITVVRGSRVPAARDKGHAWPGRPLRPGRTRLALWPLESLRPLWAPAVLSRPAPLAVPAAPLAPDFSDASFQRASMSISGRYPMKVLHTQEVRAYTFRSVGICSAGEAFSQRLCDVPTPLLAGLRLV
jgi:hypothetical protein